MSLKYIRAQYGVPAIRGARVRFIYENRVGTIVGSDNAHLRVRFDGDKKPSILHPTWELEYLSTDLPQHLIDVEQLRAAIRLLYPDDITPTAKNVLERIIRESEPKT